MVALAGFTFIASDASADDPTTDDSFLVTFETDGGSQISAVTVESGQTVDRPSTDPTKAGWAFYGWYSDVTGEHVYDFSTPVTQNITVYALYEMNLGKFYSYTVGFNYDGQDADTVTFYFGDGTSKTVDYTSGEAPEDDRAEAVHEYSAKGIYHMRQVATNSNGSSAGFFKVEIMGFPVISFDSKGGSSVAPIEQTAYNVEAVKPADPTKAGFYFDGWYTTDSFNFAYDWSQGVKSSFTLYAKWTQIFTLTFNSNDGSAVADVKVLDGAKAVKPADPTKENKTFAGWFTDAGFTQPFDWNAAVTANHTLYAKWVDADTKVTITFNTNGGSNVSPQTVNVNTKVTQPAAPTKEGFTFKGWYANAALTTQFDFNAPLVSDTTVYAKWEEVKAVEYTVTFDSDGGSKVDAQTIKAGEKAKAPKAPTKEGYTFDGWFNGETKYDFNSPVKADLTFKAHWTEKVAEENGLLKFFKTHILAFVCILLGVILALIYIKETYPILAILSAIFAIVGFVLFFVEVDFSLSAIMKFVEGWRY